LTEEADAVGDLRVRSIEEGKSVLEVELLGECKGRSCGGTGGDSKDFCFCFVKKNSEGWAEFLESFDKGGEVFIGEK
jgi:hypothetical protein